MRLINIFILSWLFLSPAFSQESKPAIDRKQLEGFWYYTAAPMSCIVIQSDKAGEKLGEIDMMIQYDIRWKEGCNHDLVVTKVFVGDNTPAFVLRHLYKIGDVIEITILDVTELYFTYNSTYKGKTHKNLRLDRVPKELYEKSKVL